MISFDKGVMRSLRVGREFRERSRRRQQTRAGAIAGNKIDASPMSVLTDIDEGVR
ncbi:hypothetical protein FM113_08985 [Leucobacter sp. 7(1)]|uniref:Uncharacterized protein n=1 Tax=Microbacterium esteraromaticum TaxID=57043 RepID=A0A1R4JWY5_9MICO|nr:hypothetical protein FM113_08985 [Leucobacter sp. 7(1)]SJN36482.1 hypothetical protein FM104_09255 [Microbacterium esteraromaticum]